MAENSVFICNLQRDFRNSAWSGSVPSRGSGWVMLSFRLILNLLVDPPATAGGTDCIQYWFSTYSWRSASLGSTWVAL